MARQYDPVKAHEYYMKHRKLKGRVKLSTKVKATKKRKGKGKKQTTAAIVSALSEAGKAAAIEAQAKINVEKKAFEKKLNETMKAKIKEATAEATTDEEKQIAAEKIKLQYAEVKKQAAAAFKTRYDNEVKEIAKNKA